MQLKAERVGHIMKGHGVNGIKDHTMADPKTLGRINYVLDNFDNIYLSSIVKPKFQDKNGNPSPVVVFTKKIDGEYYVAEVAVDAKNKTNYSLSAYIGENGSSTKNGKLTSLPNVHSTSDLTSDNVANKSLPFETNIIHEESKVNG